MGETPKHMIGDYSAPVWRAYFRDHYPDPYELDEMVPERQAKIPAKKAKKSLGYQPSGIFWPTHVARKPCWRCDEWGDPRGMRKVPNSNEYICKKCLKIINMYIKHNVIKNNEGDKQ